jgi:hypothetical protein
MQIIFAIALVSTHFGAPMIGAMDGPCVFRGTHPISGADWITNCAAFAYLALVVAVSSVTYHESPVRAYVDIWYAQWTAERARTGAPVAVLAQLSDPL